MENINNQKFDIYSDFIFTEPKSAPQTTVQDTVNSQPQQSSLLTQLLPLLLSGQGLKDMLPGILSSSNAGALAPMINNVLSQNTTSNKNYKKIECYMLDVSTLNKVN